MTCLPRHLSICCAGLILVASPVTSAGAQQQAAPTDTTASFVGLVVRKGSLIPIPHAMATLLSGKVLGGSNDSGYFVARALPAGRLEVLVRVGGFLGMTKTIELRAGVVDTVQFEMTASEARKPPRETSAIIRRGVTVANGARSRD